MVPGLEERLFDGSDEDVGHIAELAIRRDERAVIRAPRVVSRGACECQDDHRTEKHDAHP